MSVGISGSVDVQSFYVHGHRGIFESFGFLAIVITLFRKGMGESQDIIGKAQENHRKLKEIDGLSSFALHFWVNYELIIGLNWLIHTLEL